MKVLLILAATVCWLSSIPAAAQVLQRDRPLGDSVGTSSGQSAQKRFWDFVACVNDRDPDGVQKLIFGWGNGRDMKSDMRAFSRRNTRCIGGDTLAMDPVVYISGLAGVKIARTYIGRPAPDYSKVSPIFTPEVVSKEKTAEGRSRLIMYAFAECVVRSDPATVFGLILTPMYTAESKVFWSKLDEPMGLCVPSAEGSLIQFNKFVLQNSFSYAALVLENASTAEQSSLRK